MSAQLIQTAVDALCRRGCDVRLGREAGLWVLRWRDGAAAWRVYGDCLERVGDDALAWLDARESGEGGEGRFAREGWA